MPIRTPDDDSEGPASPEMPSFASLRDPRRRTAVDLLVPTAEPVEQPRRPAPAPRPPEWPDLWLLALATARAALALPVKVLRRLTGA
jgi:hypothetical protein